MLFRSLDALGWDFQASDHSTRGHILEPLRPALRALGLESARSLAAQPHGRRVRYAGVVICRQRPGTAKGVFFLTLEDEGGFVNVIVWPNVFAQFSGILRSEVFLGFSGKIQREDDVVHLIVERAWKPVLPLPHNQPSRDFR